MINYDAAQVYEIGAPRHGVNPQVTEWAFQNCHPLVLALPEDEDSILRRFGAADNKAVLAFNDNTAKCREKVGMAKRLAMAANAQYREIPVRG